MSEIICVANCEILGITECEIFCLAAKCENKYRRAVSHGGIYFSARWVIPFRKRLLNYFCIPLSAFVNWLFL